MKPFDMDFLLDGSVVGQFDSRLSNGRIGPKISMRGDIFVKASFQTLASSVQQPIRVRAEGNGLKMRLSNLIYLKINKNFIVIPVNIKFNHFILRKRK